MKGYLVTGATSGIGRATALALAGPQVRLVLTGRNTHRGQQVVQACERAAPGTEVEFIPADLACLHSVRQLADAVRSRVSALDVLINNAGARFDRYEETEDGIERTFATNHLGHFLLTGLLLDRLLAGGASRVLVTGSSAHRGVRSGGEWCLPRHGYNRTLAYAKSKLANVVFAYELARRAQGTGLTCNVVDPGGVASRFARNNGLKAWLKHLTYYMLKGELISARRGADTIVHLATAQSLDGQTGGYYRERKRARSSSESRDAEAARQLWELSVDLAGLGRGQPEVPEAVEQILFG